MDPLTPDHVQHELDKIDIQIQFFDSSTATSQQAADNIGCELGQIAKSIAFMVDGRPVLVVASGDQRVDDRKLAAIYAVSRKRVKPAKPDECVEHFGYAPGGVPPVGLRRDDIPIYLEDSLQRYEQVYGAAGAHNAIFPISLAQLIAITGATIADLKRE